MPFEEVSNNNPTITRRKAVVLLSSAAALASLPVAANPNKALSAPDISRGINIPLWMDQPDGSALAPTDIVLETLVRFGFEHIRLPIDPDRFAMGGEQALKARRELNLIIEKLLGLGFSVTLDMHPQGKIGTALAMDRSGDIPLNAAWIEIAKIATDYPTDLVFPELLNEPPMWRDRWLPLRDRLAETVRKICPDHTIIWGANKYQSIYETIEFPILADTNTLLAVHYYTPLPFTHQCQNWGQAQNPSLSNLPFPATPRSPEIVEALSRLDKQAATEMHDKLGLGWNAGQIKNDFSRLAKWAQTQGQKIILNEFGALKFCADAQSRANWTEAVRNAAEQNNIGWTYWEFDRGFGFMDNRTSVADIDLELVYALIGTSENRRAG